MSLNVFESVLTQAVKYLPAMQEIWVQSLGQKDPLEKRMSTHSSIPAWRIPMNRGTWQAIVHGVAESDMTEWLTYSHIENTQFWVLIAIDRCETTATIKMHAILIIPPAMTFWRFLIYIIKLLWIFIIKLFLPQLVVICPNL